MKKTILIDNNDPQIEIDIIFIIHSSGMCLFSYPLKGVGEIDCDLLSMGLFAIKEMLKETVSQNSQLSLIDLKDKKILVEERETFFIVLITTLDNPRMRERLCKLANKFGQHFHLQLHDRHSLLMQNFSITSQFIVSIFELEEEAELVHEWVLK